MSILVVEGNPGERALLEELLAEGGYGESFGVASVREAMMCLSSGGQSGLESPVELVIMGLNLPELDGAEACRLIKSEPFMQEIIILLLAGAGEDELLARALSVGALDYINRPIVRIELMTRVRNAIQLKRERDLRKDREHELVSVTQKLEEINRTLRVMSLQDMLTGLPNRRCFEEAFDQEWRRKLRHHGSVSLLLIDLDSFGAYNEHYGYQAGDDCLRRVARVLRAQLMRPGDMVARFGGEQFMAMLPDTDSVGATVVAEGIRTKVASLRIPNPSPHGGGFLTVSIGVASTTPDSEAIPSSLIAAATSALLQAKGEGRNRVKTW